MTENAGSSASQQNKKLSLNLRTSEHDRLSAYSHDTRKSHIVEVRSLLSELVNTTAAVLTSRPIHVWQVYGGFQRIYEAILHIFHHGCVHKDPQGNPDIWPFIVGLRVLSPVLGPTTDGATGPQPGDKWIQASLQRLQLAAKIAALTEHREHVEKHYYHWALFRSLPHITAVKICLKALEENSQDELADIDPRLLVGEYYPPPGTPVVGHPDAADKMLKLKEQLYDPAIGKISVIESGLKLRSTMSLPSTPLLEEHSPPWSHTNKYKVGSKPEKQFLHQSVSLGVKESKGRCSAEPILVPQNHEKHLLLRKGKSEASLQGLRKDMANMAGIQDQSPFFCRESPDGSSGSSDWPLTSPVSQPVPFIRSDSPKLCTPSSSPIARLVKGEILSKCETGARPKEYCPTPQTKNHPPPHHQLDVSDISEPGSGISPSFFKVNYGGLLITSDGECSPHCPSGVSVRETKTPQLRRRASSGRLGSVHADSDQDSEETVDGGTSQGSRRRRRMGVSQHCSGKSVKLLVDSRGVLGSEAPKLGNASNLAKNLSKSQSSINRIKDPSQEVINSNVSMPTPSIRVEQLSYSKLHLTKEKHTEPISTGNISTPKTTLGKEVSCLLATSAPGNVVKLANSPYSEDEKVKKKTHSRSRSDGAQEIAGKLKLATSNTAPALETGMKLGDDATFGSQIRKRFMDDGGHSITPAADYGVSPRPQPGQSLIGFLSSKDKPYAELDKENAHFNISEAVIAALAQMQFDMWKGKREAGSGIGDESDEEIRILEAQIREKRRLKQTRLKTPTMKSSNSVSDSTSDSQHWIRNHSCKNESTTDYSMAESPQSSTYNSESDLLSELEEEESENPACEETPKCLTRKSSYSDKSPSVGDLTSAESVAINLLKHFSEQKLPKASELDWLVSEQDVPQKLLPLPTSVPISPDDAGIDKEVEMQMQLRGTMDWAPPRPQLILTLHTNTKRSVLMGIQRWRCAGCGMRVSESLSRHFRLCHYLGRYFCTTCHRNQTAMIPAKVLHKWDFKLYPVASFSSELLERMNIDPLINVGALNPRLYKKCRHLHQTHIYRLQLYHTLPYINTCSRAQGEKMTLGKLPIHWASDPHVYSLDDLNRIRSGDLVDSIKEVTALCIRHISKCEVCLGRGFICEICCRGEAIFPFQLDSTSLCEICSACFHAGCFSPNRCPRCIRRESRRLSHDVTATSIGSSGEERS